MGARLINARSETVHKKPSFRSAFRRRRCLFPADGWLERREEETGKQPWFITGAAGTPVSFAGLSERWERGSEPSETFTILTTGASPGLVDVHHRQSAIIEAGDFDEWLVPDTPGSGGWRSRGERTRALSTASPALSPQVRLDNSCGVDSRACRSPPSAPGVHKSDSVIFQHE